jgi:hypothetical protein
MVNHSRALVLFLDPGNIETGEEATERNMYRDIGSMFAYMLYFMFWVLFWQVSGSRHHTILYHTMPVAVGHINFGYLLKKIHRQRIENPVKRARIKKQQSSSPSS